MRASCTSDGMRVSSSIRAMAAGLHGPHHRAGHQRRPGRALGEEPGVVPAVADRLLRRARGALHQQRGGAGDRRRQMLPTPRSSPCRARRAAAAPGRWQAWPRRSRPAGDEPEILGVTACRPAARRRAGKWPPPRGTAASWAAGAGRRRRPGPGVRRRRRIPRERGESPGQRSGHRSLEGLRQRLSERLVLHNVTKHAAPRCVVVGTLQQAAALLRRAGRERHRQERRHH